MKWGAHAPSRVGFDALVETILVACPIRSAGALTDAREARALPQPMCSTTPPAKWRWAARDGEVMAELVDAAVMESKKSVCGFFKLPDGRLIMGEQPLSDEEFAAYKRHPDTFFGVVKSILKELTIPFSFSIGSIIVTETLRKKGCSN